MKQLIEYFPSTKRALEIAARGNHNVLIITDNTDTAKQIKNDLKLNGTINIVAPNQDVKSASVLADMIIEMPNPNWSSVLKDVAKDYGLNESAINLLECAIKRGFWNFDRLLKTLAVYKTITVIEGNNNVSCLAEAIHYNFKIE